MRTANRNDRAMLNNTMSNDDVYVKSQILDLSTITGYKSRKGIEKAVVVDGQIVNVVSDGYGHLPNENFFGKVEEKLTGAGIQYDTRSINRGNCSFVVDYILKGDDFAIKSKGETKGDKMKPMLRFMTSFDGSCPTSGGFGFFRQVCSNGLHVAQSVVGFKVKKRGNIQEVVLPKMDEVIEQFMNNEFYELRRKFEVMAETPIKDLSDFVKVTAEHFKLFTFASSETNTDPSLNARIVMDVIEHEANILNTSPNLWLGYNAFNELLHGKLKKTFSMQKTLDSKIFNHVYELANA